MSDPAEEFWRFSLALYARPGVAPACLALQDGQGRDVILALYCLWMGMSGRGRLGEAGLAAAEAAIGPWRREVVEPLRATRKGLKGIDGADELYARMKAIELSAEHIAHERLAGLAPQPGPAVPGQDRQALAAANLRLYVGPDAEPVIAPILGVLSDLSAA